MSKMKPITVAALIEVIFMIMIFYHLNDITLQEFTAVNKMYDIHTILFLFYADWNACKKINRGSDCYLRNLNGFFC